MSRQTRSKYLKRRTAIRRTCCMATRRARTRIAHGMRRTRRHSFPCLIWTGNSRRETRSLASRSERPSPCMRRLFGLNRRKPRWTPVRRWSLPQGPLSYTTAYTPRVSAGATRTRSYGKNHGKTLYHLRLRGAHVNSTCQSPCRETRRHSRRSRTDPSSGRHSR